MQVIKTVKGRVLSVTNEYILIYKNGDLILCQNNLEVKILQRIKIGKWYEKIIFLNRIFRTEPRCAIQVDEHEYLISYNGKIINYNIKKNSIKIEHEYIKGMKNPLSFCEQKNDIRMSEILYGEYGWNIEKAPVSIYKRTNDNWEKVFEFEAGKITHIHNIVFDSKKKCFYILTGDSDIESGIWIANSDFSIVKPLLIGKQKYRSCILFPIEDGFIFATDTPLETNYIYKAIIKDNKVSEIRELSSLPGSCIYGTKINENYYFATTVEPDPTVNSLRYKFTYKLGKGIKDRNSYIIRMSKNEKVEYIYKSKKDILPMWLFQFGNFIFPDNKTKDIVIISQSLKSGHSRTLWLGEE